MWEEARERGLPQPPWGSRQERVWCREQFYAMWAKGKEEGKGQTVVGCRLLSPRGNPRVGMAFVLGRVFAGGGVGSFGSN